MPIKFSSENNKFYSLNIVFKEKTNDTIREYVSYKIKDEEYIETVMRTLRAKKGEKMKVDFYFKEQLFSVIEIRVPTNAGSR